MAGPFLENLFSAVSLNTNQASTGVDVTFKEWGSVHAYWTAGCTGTLTVNVSNEPTGPTNWTAAATTAVAGSGNAMFSLNYATSKWVQLAYTSTSGTGAVMTANFQGKGF